MKVALSVDSNYQDSCEHIGYKAIFMWCWVGGPSRTSEASGAAWPTSWKLSSGGCRQELWSPFSAETRGAGHLALGVALPLPPAARSEGSDTPDVFFLYPEPYRGHVPGGGAADPD